MAVRKQFHFRPSVRGFFAWSVPRLIELSKDQPLIEVALSKVAELDDPYWYSQKDDRPTVRSVAEHAKLIAEADLQSPIILSADGKVMDGMHRVAKALLLGYQSIQAVQFTADPGPDFKDVYPDELDYFLSFPPWWILLCHRIPARFTHLIKK